MNTPLSLPLSLTGQDMRTYIVDQYPDSDGVYHLYVLVQNGPYDYQQLYCGKGFKLDRPDPLVAAASTLNVDHFLGNANTTDVLTDPTPPVDTSQGLQINWPSLMKSMPSIMGHVVQIGTTIASIAHPTAEQQTLEAKNVDTTKAVPFRTGFFRLIVHQIRQTMSGLSVACFDTPPTATSLKDGLLPKYVIPFLEWFKKGVTK